MTNAAFPEAQVMNYQENLPGGSGDEECGDPTIDV